MKAIETVYKGYRFRSRLEARWAVFFDSLGMYWEYETEGYQKDDGTSKYLPDFKILSPTSNLFVEIKGDPEWILKNEDKFVATHDYGGVLPGFQESLGTNNGLIFLTSIPDMRTAEMFLHPILQHGEGLHFGYMTFLPKEANFGNHVYIFNQYHPLNQLMAIPEPEMVDSINITPISITPCKYYFRPVRLAYDAARSARFEHGERG